jgi:hypothetical protein
VAASIAVRLVSDTEAGAVYSWVESDGGRSGWLLFCLPEALFRVCNQAGEPTTDGMSVNLETEEWGNRDEGGWRSFLQAAFGVWTRYRRTGTRPEVASRTFY